MKVRFGVEALEDLEAIFSHIAAHEPAAAWRTVTQFELISARLGDFPEMGNRTIRPAIRTFPVGRYLLIYEIKKDEVIIRYIRHSAQRRGIK